MGELQESGFYGLLQRVRRRPGMFVRDKSLNELEILCHGYVAALSDHGVEEPGAHFNQRFRDYLFRRFRWGVACGCARAIRGHSPSDEEAFDWFFELLDDFRNGSPPSRSTARRSNLGD